MSEPLDGDMATITAQPEAEMALDWQALRAAGIAHLEALAPQLWTDFNSHDPGITLLELLCFALTDLGYRSSLPIADLVTPPPDPDAESGSEAGDAETRRTLRRPGAFYTAHEVLNSAPVTELDLRKLIIDRNPEVINVWLLPYQRRHHVACASGRQSLRPLNEAGPASSYLLSGLWELLVDLQPGLNQQQTREVLRRVAMLYHANRNLGEDLQHVRQVETQSLMLCADIVLQSGADLNQVAAEIIHRVGQHLSPPVARHTLAGMQARGLSLEQVYEGPILRNGFILDEELQAAALPTEVCSGELVAVIMAIPGVAAVRALQLNYADPAERLADGQLPADGCLPIRADTRPVLDAQRSVLHFFEDQLPFSEDPQRVEQALQALREAAVSTISSADRPIPQGHYRDISGQLSVQQDLPVAYGVAPHGLPLSADARRRAEAVQLQGYLLLFDQLLANYLGQLRNIQRLFSTDPELRETYFADVVSGFGDVCELINDPAGEHRRCRQARNAADRDAARAAVEGHYAEQVGRLLAELNRDNERRGRFLDHLLARFGERFSDYVLLTRQLFDDDGAAAIRSRAIMLRELPYVGRRRGSGHHLYAREQQWDTENVSGVEQRVGRLLGFASTRRRNLANVFARLYEQIDEDSANDFRFRIRRSGSERVLLSSSTRYDDREAAAAELGIAVELALQDSSYQLRRDQRGRFYFNIVNADGEVVARRIQYFRSEAERSAAIAELQQELRERYSLEGLFVVENLLLRPRKSSDRFLPVCPQSDCSELADPYSWRVQVIVPAYGPRLGEPRFREFVERSIRRELPAHLLPRICFVDADRMGEFEDAWHAWLDYRSRRPGREVATNRSLNRLLQALAGLRSVYPAATLHDCARDGDEESTLVLNRSRLGTLPVAGTPGEDDEP